MFRPASTLHGPKVMATHATLATAPHVVATAQPKIHDYGIIGDCRSAALISRDGSLDWLCWPRFDSPPMFARLVDLDAGHWSIRPTSPAQISRAYVDGTNALATRFETATGSCTLIDVMTVASEETKHHELVPDHEVLRHLRCDRGEVELEIVVAPRPDFGRARVHAEQHRRLGIRWQIGSQLLALRADVPLAIDDRGDVHAVVRLRAGDTASLSLTFDQGPALLAPLGDAALERIDRSLAWWRSWSSRARYHGPWRAEVVRSALAVKLMAFAPSGAIIAAPTTSLPEAPGGTHNWDYRFCWLRDAAFTSRALLQLGYVDECAAFCGWLLHATRLTHPELRVLYDVYGKPPPRERTVEATGYRGATPVRVGNAAFAQLQLDCYGEVIDAVSQLAHVVGDLDGSTQQMLRDYGDHVCRHWRLPDHGIWEPRGKPEPRTHSRLLCWVALDRLLKLAEHGLLDKVDTDRFAAERAAIRADIEQRMFDRELGCYTAAIGNRDLDAGVLLMTWYGFHDGHDPRMRATYDAIQHRLGAGRGLLYRYDQSRAKREGAFWICSFWAVEHLAKGGGSLASATGAMRDACAYASDLGLMAEEIDPRTGDALGNFPQAYTHVGLISAALSIEERTTRFEHGRVWE